MTTFYVSNLGNDSWSGTSTSAPWATVNHVNSKLDDGTIGAGDSVLFRRGDDFSGRMWLNKSGASGSPITFGAYGSGAKPGITGTSSRPSCCEFRENASYITLDNLRFHHSSQVGIFFRQGYTSQHIIIQNCEVHDVAIGLWAIGGPDDLLITYTYFHDINDMVVNTVGGDDDFGASAMLFANGNNIEISYCETYNCIGPSEDYGHDGSSVEFYPGSTGVVTNVEVHHNYFHDNWILTEVGGKTGGRCSYVTYHHNVCVNYHGRAFTLHLSDGAGQYGTSMDNIVVENNTFYDIYADNIDPYSHAFIDCNGTANDNIFLFRNNIVYQDNGSMYQGNDTWGHYYNIWYGGISRNATLRTGELNQNPLFVDRASRDFHLQSGSPAIDSGTNTGYSIDYDGNSIPQNGTYDMGAFEYMAGVPGTGYVHAYTRNLFIADDPGDAFIGGLASQIYEDVFKTDEAAPLSNPRTCEPGPGQLTVVQEYHNMWISQGRLLWNSPLTNYGWSFMGWVHNTTLSRANGRSAMIEAYITNDAGWLMGLNSTIGLPGVPANYAHAMYLDAGGAGTILNEDGGEIYSGYNLSSNYTWMIIMGATRTKYLLYDESAGTWEVLWISADTTAGVYHAMANYQGAGYITALRALNQPSPWNEDRAYATGSVATPSLGQQFYHKPDTFMEFTITAMPAPGEALQVAFRYQDSGNMWFVEIGASTGGIRLVQRESSSNTYRITQSSGAAVGSRLVVKAKGNDYSLWHNGVLVGQFTSSGFLSNEDSVRYGGWSGIDGGAISDLIAWPTTPVASEYPDGLKPFGSTVFCAAGGLSAAGQHAGVFEVDVPISTQVADLSVQRLKGDAYELIGGNINAAAGDLAASGEGASTAHGAVTVATAVATLAANGQSPSVGGQNTVSAALASLALSAETGRANRLLDILCQVGSLVATGEDFTTKSTRIIAQSTGAINGLNALIAGQAADARIDTKQYMYPAAIIVRGDWLTDDGSPNSLWERIDEDTPDDSDYIKSARDPASSVVVFKLSGALDPGYHTNHILKYRYAREGLDAGDVTVQLREGYVSEGSPGTLIAEWTHTNVGTTPVRAYQRLSQATAANITDYRDLYVRIVASV